MNVDLGKAMGVEYPHCTVTGYTGGLLPVWDESGQRRSYACSCDIGRYMMGRYNLRAYDALPESSIEDTKHSLVIAHYERLTTAKETG